MSGLPFYSPSGNKTLDFDAGGLGSGDNVTLYVAAMPRMFSIGQPALFDAYNQWKGNTPAWVDGTMLQCVLYNSTYRVTFDYDDGNQNISVVLVDQQNDDKIIPHNQMIGPNPHNLQQIGCEGQGDLDESQLSQCYSNPEMLRTLSYQAIMDAFASNLKGAMWVNSGQQLQRKSNIMNTVLLRTQELSFLRTKAAAMTFGNMTMQAEVEAIANDYTRGLINKDTSTSSQSLGDAIEEIFQNYTVSLMSSSVLQSVQFYSRGLSVYTDAREQTKLFLHLRTSTRASHIAGLPQHILVLGYETLGGVRCGDLPRCVVCLHGNGCTIPQRS